MDNDRIFICKTDTLWYPFYVGTAKGSYAYCFAIRRPAAPFQVALDHSLFGSPPDFLIYARALSGSTPQLSFAAHNAKRIPYGIRFTLVLPRGVMRLASQSAVLRLLFKSPWTTRYLEVHRTSSFTLVPFRVRLPNYHLHYAINKWVPLGTHLFIGTAKGSRTPDSSVRG